MDRIKLLSDPNRLAILSLLSSREMTTTHLSQLLGISVQNAQYHIRKLTEAELILQTRSEMVGNLMEKYYESTFRPDEMPLEDDDLAGRQGVVLAAIETIKGIMDRGIKTMDGLDNGADDEERNSLPFGINFIMLPITENCSSRARELVSRFEEDLRSLEHEFSREESGIALMYALFPCE
jgi:DNA-binding transcriptional ArsR family regulator